MAARKALMRILVLILVTALFCTACHNHNEQDTTRMPTEASGEPTDSLQETRPTLIVGSTRAVAGEKGVEVIHTSVVLSVISNPSLQTGNPHRQCGQ